LSSGLDKKDIRRLYCLVMDDKRRHSESVLLRFDPGQLELIDKAAELAGLNRTSWFRMTVLAAAREQVEGGKGRKKRRPPV
jgi:uncharacterized protein (DUF1778 family)